MASKAGAGGMRLWQKITLSLAIAALVPVAVASTLALRLVLGGLRASTQQQTGRTLRVAINLMLSNVKEVFDAATRLSQDDRFVDRFHGAQVDDLHVDVVRRQQRGRL